MTHFAAKLLMSLTLLGHPAVSRADLPGAAARSPRAAVAAALARSGAPGASSSLERARFEGLPAPGPGLSFRARILGRSGDTGTRVAVEARRSGQILGSRQYVFRTSAETLLPVPRHAIAAGAIIRRGDLVLERVDRRAQADPVALLASDLVGRAAKRRLSPGRPVALRMVERPAAVKRGATIQVELRGAGLRITLRGRVLETGAIGAPIKVINERSGRVFSARLESPTLAVVEVGR